MTDHGYSPLSKYSSARDSILHYLCTSDWANDSFGDVEAPTGYVWRISNSRDEIFGCFDQGNMEFDSMLDSWKEWNQEVIDSPALRKELVGHFLVIEDNNGLVSVLKCPSATSLISEYNYLLNSFNAWNGQGDA